MRLFVLGGCNEALRGLLMIDRAIAVFMRATRLRLMRDLCTDGFGSALRMNERSPVLPTGAFEAIANHFRVQNLAPGVFRYEIGAFHASTPLRIRAMCMNLIRVPMRSAQPF